MSDCNNLKNNQVLEKHYCFQLIIFQLLYWVVTPQLLVLIIDSILLSPFCIDNYEETHY